MKYLCIGMISLFLVGCGNVKYEFEENQEIEQKLPKELEDCQVYEYLNLTVMRCPNSQTSVTQRMAKKTSTTIVVDGVEYVKKEMK